MSARSLPARSISVVTGLLVVGFLLLFSSHSAAFAPSDREDEGLIGAVRSVETREHLLVQTDRFDPQGRLLERQQEGAQGPLDPWPLHFVYRYDSTGLRLAEAVQGRQGEPVKETRYGYDAQGRRVAEVAAWGDGAFENASFYTYDAGRRLTRGLHYNGIRVINRNLYTYDEQGRLVRERFERNYRYAAAQSQVVSTDRLTDGYVVTMRYDDAGHIREKLVSDLTGVRQGRSEFRYDGHGNQIEERMFDAEGRATDRKAYRYEYDAVGNWTVERFEWWESRAGREVLKHSQMRERRIVYH